MLRIVKTKRETKVCQKLLNTVLNESLNSKAKFKIGFQSGSLDCSVKYDSAIWFTGKEITEGSPRFWNGFGLTANLKKEKSNNIVVEINIPTNGLNRRVSGIFAIDDETESVFLLHRGRVGGGRRGIGKKAFINWYSQQFIKVRNDSEIEEALLVGEILKKDFIRNLAGFIQNIANFKLFATSDEVNEASFLSDVELEEKTKGKKNKPNRKETVTAGYERDPYIVELAKRRAKGKCQLCKKAAPFKNKFGKPYLETHHIEWLSSDGEDSIENTIALCPNCHRRMHIVNSKDDVSILEKIARRA